MKRHCHKISSTGSGGFSLVEIMVAMVILSIGLLGMAALTTGIMKGNLHSQQVTTATTLAQEKIEKLRVAGYGAISADDYENYESYGMLYEYPAFRRETVVVLDSPMANMKTITVTVYWDDDKRSTSLQTIVSR